MLRVRDFFVPRGSGDRLGRLMLRMSARHTDQEVTMLSNTEAAAAIKTFDTEVVEMLLTLAEGERRRLVNLYTGADRTEKIARNDAVTAVLQEELDRRADDDLLAAIAISPDFVQ